MPNLDPSVCCLAALIVLTALFICLAIYYGCASGCDKMPISDKFKDLRIRNYSNHDAGEVALPDIAEDLAEIKAGGSKHVSMSDNLKYRQNNRSQQDKDASRAEVDAQLLLSGARVSSDTPLKPSFESAAS